MPKSKASKKDSSDSDSDSGPDDRGPIKKAKFDSKVDSKAKSSKSNKSDGEEDCWELGKNRFVKLREFKGKWYVDIREFYNADGEMRPGKKGIMLTMEQWQKFKDNIDEMDEAIKKNV